MALEVIILWLIAIRLHHLVQILLAPCQRPDVPLHVMHQAVQVEVMRINGIVVHHARELQFLVQQLPHIQHHQAEIMPAKYISAVMNPLVIPVAMIMLIVALLV